MESIISKPIHIEFYGMPGCGKSTVSAIVSDIMRTQDYEVKEPSRLIGNELGSLKRKVTKVANVLTFCLFYPADVIRIWKLVRKNKCKGMNASIQFINIIQKIKVYKRSKSAHVYIWDEGLIQASISLAIGSEQSANTNYEELKRLIGKEIITVPIYLSEDRDVVLERLNNRGYGNSRVDREKNEFKKEMLLCLFENKCNQILSSNKIVENNRKTDDLIPEIINVINCSLKIKEVSK